MCDNCYHPGTYDPDLNYTDNNVQMEKTKKYFYQSTTECSRRVSVNSEPDLPLASS